MADREKVINGLETIKQFFGYGLPSTAEMFDSYYGILNDAIAMLKEQDAIEPSFKQEKDGIFVWCCGSCGAYMYHIYEGIDKAKEYAKYCRQCGKKVKWSCQQD